MSKKWAYVAATFFVWKKTYGGMDLTELRRLKQLEEENRQLKKLVADLSLDKQMLHRIFIKTCYYHRMFAIYLSIAPGLA